MAIARDKSEWSRSASLMATFINVNRGEKQKPVDPRELSPYTSSGGKQSGSKIKLTPQNLHLLKGLTK